MRRFRLIPHLFRTPSQLIIYYEFYWLGNWFRFKGNYKTLISLNIVVRKSVPFLNDSICFLQNSFRVYIHPSSVDFMLLFERAESEILCDESEIDMDEMCVRSLFIETAIVKQRFRGCLLAIEFIASHFFCFLRTKRIINSEQWTWMPANHFMLLHRSTRRKYQKNKQPFKVSKSNR